MRSNATGPTARVRAFLLLLALFSQFFSQQNGYASPSDPGQFFILSHEFRHLMPTNVAIGQQSKATNIRNRLLGRNNPDPAEDDADRFARLFTTTCPCGVSK